MSSSLAQIINNPALNSIFGNPTGTGESQLSQLISILITTGIIIGILAFMGYFIWGAIKWITSGSDKGRTQEARTQITQALIGLVILLSLFLILAFLSAVFGLNLLNLCLPFPNSGPCSLSETGGIGAPGGGRYFVE